jgi:hypothetical protein
MVSTGIFCNDADVARKAKNMNADIDNGDTAETDAWIADAESLINCVCRFNFSDTFAAENVDVKYLLREVASNIAAIYAITYDMSGFTSRVEAEDMINVLRDAALRGLAILRDKKVVEFIKDA